MSPLNIINLEPLRHGARAAVPQATTLITTGMSSLEEEEALVDLFARLWYCLRALDLFCLDQPIYPSSDSSTHLSFNSPAHSSNCSLAPLPSNFSCTKSSKIKLIPSVESSFLFGLEFSNDPNWGIVKNFKDWRNVESHTSIVLLSVISHNYN